MQLHWLQTELRYSETFQTQYINIILTFFTPQVPYLERAVVAASDDGGLAEELSRHHFAAVPC